MPLFRRVPKRGFSHATWDKNYHVVNVGDLDERSTTAPPSTPAALEASRPGQRHRATASASSATAS